MITRIEAGNYRCFRNLSIDVDPYQVIAGMNGSGKSTLVDIPILLSDIVRAERVLDAFLNRRGPRPPRATSPADILFQGNGSYVVLAVEALLPPEVQSVLASGSTATRRPMPTHLRYELRLELFNLRLQVAEEYLFLFAEDDRRPTPGLPMQGARAGMKTVPGSRWWPIIRRRAGSGTELFGETSTRRQSLSLRIEADAVALASIPADESLFPATRWFIGLLRGRTVSYDPDWDVLRQAARPGDPGHLLPDARNTAWLAYDLAAGDPARFRRWVDHVRTALPSVEDITVRVRPDDNAAYFEVSYLGGHRVTSSGLSDGTVRILALSLPAYLPSTALPTLLVTEEPENGIHPQAIETVLSSLQSVRGSQVWISTHSPIVLARTELSDILATRMRDDGSVDVVAGEQHPRLRDWQGALDLGTLFASGVLS